MSRLVLKFEGSTLKEVPLGNQPVTIGRSPDNDIPIDNLAVANYHARVYVEAGSLVVEDLNSLNGSFLNDIRIERAMLKDGDAILIGKHHIFVDQMHDAAQQRARDDREQQADHGHPTVATEGIGASRCDRVATPTGVS